MKTISKLWAERLEAGDGMYTFYDVPAQLKEEVLQKLHEDGYVVDDEGHAVLSEDNK